MKNIQLMFDFDHINPGLRDWHPLPVHNDPEPNPRFVIGAPHPRSSLGELFAWYKRTRTVEELTHDIGRGR